MARTLLFLGALIGAILGYDIATLMEQNESQVVDRLDKLHALGLLRWRKIQGMNYFTVANEDLKNLLHGELFHEEMS